MISSQGDMGEDGPKGDMGEKVREFLFTFHSLWTCTEKSRGLAVAAKHQRQLMLAIWEETRVESRRSNCAQVPSAVVKAAQQQSSWHLMRLFVLNVDLIAMHADATFSGWMAPALIWDHLSWRQLVELGSISNKRQSTALLDRLFRAKVIDSCFRPKSFCFLEKFFCFVLWGRGRLCVRSRTSRCFGRYYFVEEAFTKIGHSIICIGWPHDKIWPLYISETKQLWIGINTSLKMSIQLLIGPCMNCSRFWEKMKLLCWVAK